MSEIRTVPMSAEAYEEIERHIVELMRAKKNERAATMMNLALAWRFAKPVEPTLPDNVVQFPGHSVRAS